MERPDFFELKNGEKVKLPFSDKEYKNRVNKLRSIMDKNNLDMIIFTNQTLSSSEVCVFSFFLPLQSKNCS